MEYPYESISFKQIHDLLGKYLKVHLLSGFKTTKTESLEGYLYTVDPVTKTLVLLKEKEISVIKNNQEQINEKEQKEEENNNTFNKYQIIVIMKSIIQKISVINEKEPLTDEELATVIPDQKILYLEKTDSIENLKESLIKYLEKNKIDYVTQPDELSIKIYNNKVEIVPPYTQSCIKSDDYGSKDIAIHHIKKWWDEK